PLRVAADAARRMERQVASGLAAHVEVLVEPAVWRNEGAALVPGDDDLFATLGPHDRVALAGGDHDLHAGPVPMALLVAAGGEHRHVVGDRRVRILDPHDVATGAAALEGDQAIPGTHVGEEVAPPDRALTPPAGASSYLRLGVEV